MKEGGIGMRQNRLEGTCREPKDHQFRLSLEMVKLGIRKIKIGEVLERKEGNLGSIEYLPCFFFGVH